MRNLTFILILALGFFCNAQTNVTNTLNATLPGSPGILMLGCCNDDGLSPEGTNTDLCVFREYVAYGDVVLNRSKLILRNAKLTIINGSLDLNGAELEFTCGASIEGAVIDSNNRCVYNSINDFPEGTRFYIMSISGRVLIEGNHFNKEVLDQLRRGVYIIHFKGCQPHKFAI